MCEAECNYAAVTLPSVGLPRSLKLSDPLHYTIDASGNIKIDSNTHAVSNGYLTTLSAEPITGLSIQIKVVFPSSIGCNAINFVNRQNLPKMTVTARNITVQSNAPNQADGNVLNYLLSVNLPPGPVCLSTISFSDATLGTVSLGCGCDRSSGCERLPTTLFLNSVFPALP